MIVNGKNVILRIYDNGGWRLYACATSCSINVATSTVETSTTGSGVWRTYKPQANTWGGTAEGVVYLEEAGMLSLADLRAKQIAFEEMQVSYERTDEGGNVYREEGIAIIINSGDTGDVNGVATFSLELQGTGELVQYYTPSNLELSAVRRYPTVGSAITATGGETVITIPSLIGKDILVVVKDGISNDNIITSGTPASKQVKYTSASGAFEWAVPFEANETYHILYQDIL